jgi:hypothetical protein
MISRKNTILFDFNNLAYRTYFIKDVQNIPEEEQPNIKLWKYLLIDNIHKVFYKIPNINEIVLAVDDFISWRKIYWNRYKESRKKHRENQPRVDWQYFFDALNTFVDEIREHLPFKIIRIQSAEADDIIATLCIEKQENDYTIISNDEDFLQLTGMPYPYVKLYCPNKEKYISVDDPKNFITKLCLLGQPKDDIFNIRTPLDWPQGERKPAFGEKMLQRVMTEGVECWLKRNNLEERYNVNKNLIDFHQIPKVIRRRILTAYETYELPNPDYIYSYFNKNKFTSMIENYDKVEKKLLSLY